MEPSSRHHKANEITLQLSPEPELCQRGFFRQIVRDATHQFERLVRRQLDNVRTLPRSRADLIALCAGEIANNQVVYGAFGLDSQQATQLKLGGTDAVSAAILEGLTKYRAGQRLASISSRVDASGLRISIIEGEFRFRDFPCQWSNACAGKQHLPSAPFGRGLIAVAAVFERASYDLENGIIKFELPFKS